jgi:hypothetical protein
MAGLYFSEPFMSINEAQLIQWLHICLSKLVWPWNSCFLVCSRSPAFQLSKCHCAVICNGYGHWKNQHLLQQCSNASW